MEPTIAIVDVADGSHGRLMAKCASSDGKSLRILWIEPTLSLPDDLRRLPAVDAVAIPVSVRGATSEDRFTRRLLDAIQDLRTRGVLVFVAAGNRTPNLLAEAGIRVPIRQDRRAEGSSGACVRAAVQFAYRARAVEALNQTYGERDP
jgi:hypothetical protein